MPDTLPRLAILASGRGSNAGALMAAFASGFLPARLVLLLSDQARAEALQRARDFGIDALARPRAGLSRAEHEEALLQVLHTYQVEHVLLAGYMRLLSAHFLARFAGTVLNIHPALLPEFPGLRAAERQAAAGRKVVGATVHAVDAGIDTGPILLQGSMVVRDDETPEQVVTRLRCEVEHVLYPRAVRLFLDRLHDAAFA